MDAQPAAAQTGGGDEPMGESRGKRSKSLVNPETVTYLEEIVAHFKTLVDDEERSLLVGNVLEEIAGKEVKVAGDPVCSRHVETLMAAAQAGQLLKFLTSVADLDGFSTLVTSPFGSHVVEKLLIRLEGQMEAMSQEEYDQFEKVMGSLTDVICPHLYDYVTDRFATHVVRRLLCLLAGRNVLPPPSGKGKGQQQLPGLENKRSKGEPVNGLAAKLGGGGGGGGGGGKAAAAAALAAEFLGGGGGEDGAAAAPPCRLPGLVGRFVGVVCGDEYAGAVVSELVYHPYACPFLQALLRAAASDRKALRQLVPALLGATTFHDGSKGGAGVLLESCKAEEVAALVCDPTASHLAEAMVQVLPRSLFEEFHRRMLAGRLGELAHHPHANFVVQAAIAAAPTKEIAKSMYDSLAGELPELLRRRRSGVVAALVAACGRHGVAQREVCGALAAALRGQPQWAHLQGDAALAPALMCLDAAPLLGGNEPFSAATVAAARGGGGGSSLPRLSTVGCSILIQVLRYGQGACRAFTDSVAALQPHDAARAGADPSGSRVLEALLDGNAPPKLKAALLAGLGGHWDAVAATASGSFLVEAAYRWGDLGVKEAIVSRLVGATKALEVTHWGPALLRKVGAEAYSRDPEQWRRHAASAAKTLEQFSKIFGDGGGGGGDAKAKGKGKAGREQGGGGPGEGAAAEGAEGPGVEAAEDKADGEGSRREHKRAKKEKKRAAAAEAAAAAGVEAPKPADAAEEDAAAAAEAGPAGGGAGAAGAKGKKAKKQKRKGGEGTEAAAGGAGAGEGAGAGPCEEGGEAGDADRSSLAAGASGRGEAAAAAGADDGGGGAKQKKRRKVGKAEGQETKGAEEGPAARPHAPTDGTADGNGGGGGDGGGGDGEGDEDGVQLFAAGRGKKVGDLGGRKDAGAGGGQQAPKAIKAKAKRAE